MSTDLLIPKRKSITVGDRQYQIGKLSIFQQVEMVRFFTENIVSSQEKLAEIAKKTKGSTSNMEDLMSIVTLLKPSQINRFFAIILDEKDEKYIGDHLDILEEGTEIIATVCESIDIEKVKKNIQRVIKAFNRKIS